MSNETQWLSDEEQELWRLIIAAQNRLASALDASLQLDSKLSSADFAVLVVLSEAPEQRLRLRDLCATLEWDRSRTSHQVTRMAGRGLVEKTPCGEDGRGILISITADGLQRLEAAAPNHVGVVRQLVFDHLDGDAVPHVKAFLQGIVDVDDLPVRSDLVAGKRSRALNGK